MDKSAGHRKYDFKNYSKFHIIIIINSNIIKDGDMTLECHLFCIQPNSKT